ncbi:MAG: hypothetical protein J7494_07555 [Sphingobium sp.]|nr:hypothetical protein [Sphingobium sp.]
MLFYVIGSLLFMTGIVLALGVIAANLTRYRVQMIAALRTLSLDSVHATPRSAAIKPLPARPLLRPAA